MSAACHGRQLGVALISRVWVRTQYASRLQRNTGAHFFENFLGAKHSRSQDICWWGALYSGLKSWRLSFSRQWYSLYKIHHKASKLNTAPSPQSIKMYILALKEDALLPSGYTNKLPPKLNLKIIFRPGGVHLHPLQLPPSYAHGTKLLSPLFSPPFSSSSFPSPFLSPLPLSLGGLTP